MKKSTSIIKTWVEKQYFYLDDVSLEWIKVWFDQKTELLWGNWNPYKEKPHINKASESSSKVVIGIRIILNSSNNEPLDNKINLPINKNIKNPVTRCSTQPANVSGSPGIFWWDSFFSAFTWVIDNTVAAKKTVLIIWTMNPIENLTYKPRKAENRAKYKGYWTNK